MTKTIKIKPIIGIIGGRGRMGNWFKVFFERLDYKVLISDINTKLSNIELAQKADIVIVSVSIKETIKVIQEVRKWVKKEGLICDITSLKTKQVKAMKKAKSGALGMHPLFGPLVQTLDGQKIIFCKIKNNYWVEFLREIFTKNGAEIIEVSPEEHDRQMAIVQALIHFTNISLAKTLYSQKITLKSLFLTSIFRLQSLIIGRILSQSPELYAEIEMENPYFKKILNDFNIEVKSLTKDINNKDFESFIKKFKQASLCLEGFKEIAQTKSIEILKILEKQPIKIKMIKRKIDFKKKLKIGFLGPEGTFSHQAALEIMPKNFEFISLTAIKEVFEEVNNQKIDLGIIPIENTIGGIVSETINCLIEYPLKVTGSYNLNVHQCLLSWGELKSDLKVIKTHYQAFSQCRSWLEKNLPKVYFENSQSTTLPILETLKTKDKTIGFIANEIAANVYNLNILAKSIEDSKENITKFYLISQNIDKNIVQKLKSKKTLILLAIYDRVGVLRDILNVFAENNINLSSLHSIPSKIKPWDYFFFLEVDVYYPCLKIKKILKQLEQYCSIIRILGVS